MSFRIYCMNEECREQLSTPYWSVDKWTFCNPECHKTMVEIVKLKKQETKTKEETP